MRWSKIEHWFLPPFTQTAREGEGTLIGVRAKGWTPGWKESFIAMFTIYFDASGHPDGTEVLTIAGFLATAEDWIRIDKRWKVVLAKYGVSELHMKHYAHSFGEFLSWKDQPEKRAAFLVELIEAIRSRVRHSFACSLWVEDYNNANADNKLRTLTSPLAVIGITCIQKIQSWADSHRVPRDEILYALANGDIDKGNFMKCAEVLMGVDVVPMNKERSVGFQAADLLAFEHFQVTKKMLRKPPEIHTFKDIRKPLKALCSIPCGKNKSDWVWLSGPELTKVLLSFTSQE